jgi:hypothetical protein
MAEIEGILARSTKLIYIFLYFPSKNRRNLNEKLNAGVLFGVSFKFNYYYLFKRRAILTGKKAK